MLVAPVLAPVASPSDPEALEMEATLGLDELQVTVVVRSLGRQVGVGAGGGELLGGALGDGRRGRGHRP